LRELWLGCRVSDVGVEKLAASLALYDTQLRVLGLGGAVRGGALLTNLLGPDAARMLGEALRHNPAPALSELRLTGNSSFGAEGCIRLAQTLQARYLLRIYPCISPASPLHLSGRHARRHRPFTSMDAASASPASPSSSTLSTRLA
jgi:hypothetical protein